MSDDPFFTGLAPADPNAAAVREAMIAHQKKYLNSYLSAPLAALAPDPRLAGATGLPNAVNYIPLTGAVEAFGGFAGQAIGAVNDVSNWIDSKIGLPIKAQLPGGAPAALEGAGQHFEQTRNDIQQDIGAHTPLTAPDPNDPMDRITDLVGSTMGMAVPHMPSAAGKFITGLLPRIVRPAANLILSTPEHAVQNVGATTGLAAYNVAGEAVENVLDEPATPAAAPVKVAANTTPSTLSDARVDLGFGKALQPSAPAPNDLGFSAAMRGTEPTAPELDATGYSSHTMLHAGLTLGAVMFGLGAARFMHGTTRVITDAERAARFNDPEYAAKAADYNNSRVARTGTDVSAGVDPVTPPPLPEHNRVRQGMNYLNNQVLNDAAQVQDAIRMTARPSEAEALAHMYGNTHDQSRFRTKLESFLETGRHAETGVRTEPAAPFFRDVAGLGPDQERVLMEGLGAANEQDNRVLNQRAYAASGATTPPAIEDIRHDFKNQDDGALAAAHARMMADPVTADLAQRYWRLSNGSIDIGERLNFFPSAEAAKLRNDHQHYVPEVNVNGETVHPFGRRDKTISAGVEQMNTKPWYAMAQHMEELHRQFELNTMNQHMRSSLLEAQRSNPTAAQFVYDVPPPSNNPTFYSGGSFRDPIIAIRTGAGVKFTRVDHPDIFNAMTGNSLMKRRTALGALGHLKNWTQYWTTGPGSLITGRIPGPINAAYTGLVAGANTPKNMYAGALDRIVQRATGRTSGVARGIDTVATTLPGVAGSYARGVADRAYNRFGMGDRLANLVARGNRNPINDTLRAYLGHNNVDALEGTLRNYYYNTDTFKMQSELGLGGQGTPVKSDVSSLVMPSDRESRLVSASLVPKMFVSNGAWPDKGRAVAIKLNRLVSETMGHLSDATHDYIARLNMDNPNINKQTLSYEVRNLVGNPAVRGANQALKAITGVVPYANVGMQGTARLGRAFLEQPRLALTSTATSLGTLALIELLTHMRSHAHMDYFNNQLSTQQHGGYITLATNDDPTKSTMVAVPQELRPAHALALEVMSKVLNIAGARHDPDWFKTVWDGISDFLGSHVTNTSMDSMLHGAIDATDFINLPRWAGNIDWFGAMHGKSLADSYRPVTAAHGPGSLPNQVPDGLLDDKQGQLIHQLLNSTFGGLALAFDDLNNASRYAKQYGSWMTGLGHAGHDWLLSAMDRNPNANMLFEHQLRLLQQAPITEMMQPRLDALKKITGARTAGLEEGWTGRGRYAQQVPMSTERKLPTDPTMLALYGIASAYKTRMTGRETEIAEIKKQMGSVQQHGYDAATRREWMNSRTRDVADKYRMLNAQLNDLDYALSQRVGKPVHLENIDFSKGPEQFN